MACSPTPRRVDAYRGAGRPEATFLLERLVDLVAVEVGKDPAEVRRINLIPKFDNGHDRLRGPDLRQRRLRSRA